MKFIKKDFISGLLFLAVALFFFVNSLKYKLGTVESIGPGLFPFVISILLFVFGVLVIVKAYYDR